MLVQSTFIVGLPHFLGQCLSSRSVYLVLAPTRWFRLLRLTYNNKQQPQQLNNGYQPPPSSIFNELAPVRHSRHRAILGYLFSFCICNCCISRTSGTRLSPIVRLVSSTICSVVTAGFNSVPTDKVLPSSPSICLRPSPRTSILTQL